VSLRQKEHLYYKSRQEKFISVVPVLIAKAIDSSVNGNRFSDLLHKVAEANSIAAEELKEICQTALNRALDEMLQTRIPTTAEMHRIAEILRPLEDTLGTFEIEEKLTKVVILTELWQGRIPELVEVRDPMPIE